MQNEKILLIYTGGTIGMRKNEFDVLVPSGLSDLVKLIPEIKAYNLVYSSFPNPIDSSQIAPKDWQKIYDTVIESSCEKVVLLHGTDTMAYSASALAVLLGNTDKTVIFTGSQLPASTENSDAKSNLINALKVAKDASVRGVYVSFCNHLYSALHVKKASTTNFEGFNSPNCSAIAVNNGLDVLYSSKGFFGLKHGLKLQCSIEYSPVLTIQFSPAMSIDIYKDAILHIKTKVIILEVFGSGTAPFTQNSQWFLNLKKAHENGVHILVKPACVEGELHLGTYEAGNALQALNPIICKSLSSEAVYALSVISVASDVSPQILFDLV